MQYLEINLHKLYTVWAYMHLSSPFPLRSWGERVCTAYFVISAYKHIVQCKRRHLKVALRGGLLINFHAVQSSLKIKLIRDGHFGAVKGQTNKRTHSHTHTHTQTHWYPIALENVDEYKYLSLHLEYNYQVQVIILSSEN